MQLATRDGISCDLCATPHREHFTYYSVDVRETVCRIVPIPLDQLRRNAICFSFDACTDCYDELARRIVHNYRPGGTGVRCELNGQHLMGNFTYYYVEVAKVLVSPQRAAACSRCGAALPSGDAAPCSRCHHDGRTQQHAVLPDPRFLEFTISVPAYEDLVERVLGVRKAAAQWSPSNG